MVFIMIMNRSVIATNTTRHIFAFSFPNLTSTNLTYLKLATFTTRHTASLHWSLTHFVTVWPPDWVIGKLTSAETVSYTSRCHRIRQQRPRHRHITPDILCDIGLRYGQFATEYQRPFTRWTWVSRCLLKQRMMEVAVTTGAINRAKFQSNHHHQQTNQHPVFLQAGCPSCYPTNNNVKVLKGNILHSMDLCTPSSPGVFQLCLWPLYKKYKWVTGFALGLYIDMYVCVCMYVC